MAFSAADLAPRLIIWPTRWRNGIVRWPGTGSALAAGFAEHLAARDRGRHLEDLRCAVSAVLEEFPALLDWYRASLIPFGAALRFEEGAPRLRQGSLGAWRKLTAEVDADALITLSLAGVLPRGIKCRAAIELLPHWGFFISTGDHGLDRILQAGLADIHVHFEASDPLPLLWLRLSSGHVRASELNFFSNATLRQLGQDDVVLRQRSDDRETLEDAPERRGSLAEAIGFRLEISARHRAPVDWLAEERALLLSAWRVLLDPLRDEEQRDGISLKLDRYLSAKSLFLQCHQQRAGEGPGLTRFRDYLDRGESLGEKKRKKTNSTVRRLRMERMLSLATSSPNLHTVELRIAPQDTLKGWIDFFRVWERSFAGDGAGPDIRFVVHFIRKNWPTGKETVVDHGGLRRKLDRQTAMLQLFRHRCPNLARYIVGIDVANLERGFPPQVFAPYLQLLRGERRLAGAFDTELLDCWARVAVQELDWPHHGLPRLGLTYHAGEDFYHPLDGLRSLSGLLDHVLEPGDRIGHGLAAGWDLKAFERDRGPAPVPVGVLLDDLIWLRGEVSSCGDWTGHCQIEADKLIHDLVRDIYGFDPGPATLERALAAAFEVPRHGHEGSTYPHLALAGRIAFDPGILAKRRSFSDEAQARVLSATLPLLPAVQTRLVRRMRDRGVAVEACPTSNFVTGAVESLSRHPYFGYLEALNQQSIVTINTDDPGVFGTTLEIEYALMFDAMLERGLDRATALDLLEQSRKLAFAYSFVRRASGSA